MAKPSGKIPIPTSITPWLMFYDCAAAVAFYKSAFGACETYKLETPDGLVVRLSINGAEFWLSTGALEEQHGRPIGDNTIRMILTVDDPYPLFESSIRAGAKEVFPISEGHGWLLGRIVDPFGLHWEIGHPISK